MFFTVSKFMATLSQSFAEKDVLKHHDSILCLLGNVFHYFDTLI